MKKSLQLFGLLLIVSLAMLIKQGYVYARLTGTPPTSADIFCVGPTSLEVCVDASANLVPTTTGIGSLGTSSLKFNTINVGSVVPSDTTSSRLHAVSISTTGMITMVPGAAGDLYQTTINGNRFALCFATAAVANSVVLSTAPNVRCADAVSQNGQLP